MYFHPHFCINTYSTEGCFRGMEPPRTPVQRAMELIHQLVAIHQAKERSLDPDQDPLLLLFSGAKRKRPKGKGKVKPKKAPPKRQRIDIIINQLDLLPPEIFEQAVVQTLLPNFVPEPMKSRAGYPRFPYPMNRINTMEREEKARLKTFKSLTDPLLYRTRFRNLVLRPYFRKAMFRAWLLRGMEGMRGGRDPDTKMTIEEIRAFDLPIDPLDYGTDTVSVKPEGWSYMEAKPMKKIKSIIAQRLKDRRAAAESWWTTPMEEDNASPQEEIQQWRTDRDAGRPVSEEREAFIDRLSREYNRRLDHAEAILVPSWYRRFVGAVLYNDLLRWTMVTVARLVRFISITARIMLKLKPRLPITAGPDYLPKDAQEVQKHFGDEFGIASAQTAQDLWRMLTNPATDFRKLITSTTSAYFIGTWVPRDLEELQATGLITPMAFNFLSTHSFWKGLLPNRSVMLRPSENYPTKWGLMFERSKFNSRVLRIPAFQRTDAIQSIDFINFAIDVRPDRDVRPYVVHIDKPTKIHLFPLSDEKTGRLNPLETWLPRLDLFTFAKQSTVKFTGVILSSPETFSTAFATMVFVREGFSTKEQFEGVALRNMRGRRDVAAFNLTLDNVVYRRPEDEQIWSMDVCLAAERKALELNAVVNFEGTVDDDDDYDRINLAIPGDYINAACGKGNRLTTRRFSFYNPPLRTSAS